jgi:tetratricopeptide (TPR) repeat protein
MDFAPVVPAAPVAREGGTRMMPRSSIFALAAVLGALTSVCGVTKAVAATQPAPQAAPQVPPMDEQTASAERALRAAELRPVDDRALAFYREAQREAEDILARCPESAWANFIYFAATGRILIADGIAKNLFALRALDKKYLDRALELDPRLPNALAAKGGVLLDLPFYLGGDPEEAQRLLERALDVNPSGVGTRITLAKAMARNGDTAGAHRQAMRAAHYACMQRRRKALDDASALIDELDSKLAKAGTR